VGRVPSASWPPPTKIDAPRRRAALVEAARGRRRAAAVGQQRAVARDARPTVLAGVRAAAAERAMEAEAAPGVGAQAPNEPATAAELATEVEAEAEPAIEGEPPAAAALPATSGALVGRRGRERPAVERPAVERPAVERPAARLTALGRRARGRAAPGRAAARRTGPDPPGRQAQVGLRRRGPATAPARPPLVARHERGGRAPTLAGKPCPVLGDENATTGTRGLAHPAEAVPAQRRTRRANGRHEPPLRAHVARTTLKHPAPANRSGTPDRPRLIAAAGRNRPVRRLARSLGPAPRPAAPSRDVHRPTGEAARTVLFPARSDGLDSGREATNRPTDRRGASGPAGVAARLAGAGVQLPGKALEWSVNLPRARRLASGGTQLSAPGATATRMALAPKPRPGRPRAAGWVCRRWQTKGRPGWRSAFPPLPNADRPGHHANPLANRPPPRPAPRAARLLAPAAGAFRGLWSTSWPGRSGRPAPPN
jgi:hypothetical protein